MYISIDYINGLKYIYILIYIYMKFINKYMQMYIYICIHTLHKYNFSLGDQLSEISIFMIVNKILKVSLSPGCYQIFLSGSIKTSHWLVIQVAVNDLIFSLEKQSSSPKNYPFYKMRILTEFLGEFRHKNFLSTSSFFVSFLFTFNYLVISISPE